MEAASLHHVNDHGTDSIKVTSSPRGRRTRSEYNFIIRRVFSMVVFSPSLINGFFCLVYIVYMMISAFVPKGT
jgi:hypothetical protein